MHDAISRSIEALEAWLQLQYKSLPYGVIRNAYLHFEALSTHAYEFTCVLCGFYPPMLVLDVDKKGMFDLAGEVDIVIMQCHFILRYCLPF